jgi:site-specific DNA-methyltransferase (adenine-specific)
MDRLSNFEPGPDGDSPVPLGGAPRLNAKNTADGYEMLRGIESNSAALVFLDPQHRAILDKMNYGNEGERQGERSSQVQMSVETINKFAAEIVRVLRPSGHVCLWLDKFILCGYGAAPTFPLDWTVDLITWDKLKIGMGYRTRRRGEYLMICQKPPRRAKGIWVDHGIPDVWPEKRPAKSHPHAKPLELQSRILLAVTGQGDLVVDPRAGGYGVLDICRSTDRNFLGCDVNEVEEFQSRELPS